MRVERSVPASEPRIKRALVKFRDVLRKKSLRMTPVREAIVRGALEHTDHFDAQKLARRLQANGVHEASMATVYRTMPLLVEAGILQQTLLSSGEGVLYEIAFEREHHDHLVCTVCGKVIEFHFEAFERLQKDLAAKYDFELTRHVHELLGRCSSCRRAARARA
jgi:Fur family ferric uptake transcriptional regulator